MRLRALVFAATAALAFSAGVETTSGGSGGCKAGPVVDSFITALNSGDLERIDQLFAAEAEGWDWYSVGDRAGRRLSAESKDRATLRAYFAARLAQHEQLSLLRIDENGDGHFGMVLTRRADDLRDGKPVERAGKGWVSCATQKIGVWSLGGAPPPKTFGPCPSGTLPFARSHQAGARSAVLRFVRDTFSEMYPSIDVDGARVRRVAPASVGVTRDIARIKCAPAVIRRTAAVGVRFPRVYSTDPMSQVSFYASRTGAGWLVWNMIS